MIHHTVSDNELIVSYLNGNENSFRQLIKKYERQVFTSILLLVRNRGVAEDLFQETFIKVIISLRDGKYHDEGKFPAWVIRIAHNLTIDYFRINKRMYMIRESEEHPIFERMAGSENNIEETIIRNGNDAQLRELVEELPFKLRETLIMRHYGEMSFKEIARCTHTNLNTALGRMRYALNHIRKAALKKNIRVELE